jgi:hypothetical protein
MDDVSETDDVSGADQSPGVLTGEERDSPGEPGEDPESANRTGWSQPDAGQSGTTTDFVMPEPEPVSSDEILAGIGASPEQDNSDEEEITQAGPDRPQDAGPADADEDKR